MLRPIGTVPAIMVTDVCRFDPNMDWRSNPFRIGAYGIDFLLIVKYFQLGVEVSHSNIKK